MILRERFPVLQFFFVPVEFSLSLLQISNFLLDVLLDVFEWVGQDNIEVNLSISHIAGKGIARAGRWTNNHYKNTTEQPSPTIGVKNNQI